MQVKRYVPILCIKRENNELIPIWNQSIKYVKSERFGEIIELDETYEHYSNITEAILDLKTKEIKIGIELDIFSDTNFKIGETVMVEKSHQKLYQSKIVDIVFEDYDLQILRGNKVDKYITDKFPDYKFTKEELYALKHWKPFYILENGEKIEYHYKLNHIVKY